MLATPVRSSAWSSTTSTAARAVLTAGETSASSIGLSWNGEGRRFPREHHFGAGARRGHDRERGADPFGALLHAGHSEAGIAMFPRDAAPIVSHREPEAD